MPAPHGRARPASRASRRRRLFNWGLVAGVLAAFACWILVPRGARGGAPPPLERIPAGKIGFPRVSSDARAGLDRAVEELRRADSVLDAGGDPSAAEPALAAAFELVERAGAWTPDLAGHHHQFSLLAFAKGRLPEAEARARRWVERFPEDYHHLFLLGRIRYALGKWAPARESMASAARAAPAWWEPWHWLAEICFQMGAREEGVAAVRKALEAIGYPGGSGARAGGDLAAEKQVLGNAVKVLHRFREYELLTQVARDYRTRITGLPEEAIVECSMAEGIALAELGRHSEAEPLLRKALAARANADDVALHLGMALSKSGKLEEARSTLAALLAESPHFAKAYHQLGLVLSRLGKKREAAAMFGKSDELASSERESRRETELRGAGHPGRAAAAAATGHVLAGRYGDAEAALRKRELRDEPYAVFALAELYLDSLRSLEAEKVLEQGAALVGERHADVEGYRGLALRLRGDSAGLERLRAAASGSTSGVWPVRLGRVLLEDGDLRGAIAVLEPARRNEADREASFFFGRALLESGEAARALEVLRPISTADTRWDSWEGDAWLARVLASSGKAADHESAASLLEAVPERRRSGSAYLAARVALLERKGGKAEDIEAARAALARHQAREPEARELRRRIASTPWPGSAPLYRDLARLEAGRGSVMDAVRWARISLQADPRSVEALRDLAGWLRGEGDVFYRLRALREITRMAPGDVPAREEAARIEAEWLPGRTPSGTG